jgi:hypothetical protein
MRWNIQKVPDEPTARVSGSLVKYIPLLLESPGVHPESHTIIRDKNDLRIWVIVLVVAAYVVHLGVFVLALFS